MTRDLQKSVPPAVLETAKRVLAVGKGFHEGLLPARNARTLHLALSRMELARDNVELNRMSEHLFEWGLGLRRQLPSEALYKRFCGLHCEDVAISVVNEEIALEARGDAPAGRLRTELLLNLYPDPSWLFRRYEWFDGYGMHGGDQLNTITSILIGLHPAMLRAIHERIAEGDVWTRVEYGLKKLCEDSKDR